MKTNHIKILRDRIENLAHNSLFRNKFDICTTRAVSRPSTVAEYILPMLNLRGTGILYCGKWNEREQKQIEKALSILGGSLLERKQTFLPFNTGERNIIYVKPKILCPKLYPRKVGKPTKYPLGH